MPTRVSIFVGTDLLLRGDARLHRVEARRRDPTVEAGAARKLVDENPRVVVPPEHVSVHRRVGRTHGWERAICRWKARPEAVILSTGVAVDAQ